MYRPGWGEKTLLQLSDRVFWIRFSIGFFDRVFGSGFLDQVFDQVFLIGFSDRVFGFCCSFLIGCLHVLFSRAWATIKERLDTWVEGLGFRV